MNIGRRTACGLLSSWILLAAFLTPVQAEEGAFTLTRQIPADVFLYVGGRHNPERAFLEEYWGEVFTALKNSGIGDDLLELIGSMMDAGQKSEMERLKGLARDLIAGVDWSELGGGEFAFAERFRDVQASAGGGINFGPPDMVWIFRNNTPKTAENYAGLVAIMNAFVEELNRFSGGRLNLVVDETDCLNARVARLMATEGPRNPSIGLTMTPAGAEKLAAATEAHLGRLMLMLWDGKPLNGPIMINSPVSEHAQISGGFSANEAEKLSAEIQAAVTAAQSAGADYKPRLQCRLVASAEETQSCDEVQVDGQTLRLTPESIFDERGIASVEVSVAARIPLPVTLAVAHRDDVIAIFFGEKILNEVLGALDGTPGVPMLADSARFQQAVGKVPAPEDSLLFFDFRQCFKPFRPLVDALVSLTAANVDVYDNVGGNEEATRLNGEAMAAYERGDVKEALRLVVQAYETNQKDSVILYNLACFNSLEGRKEAAFNALEQAVEGGFYAPSKIQSDPDLAGLRTDARFQQILSRAMELAGQDEAEDVILNSTYEGPLADIHTQILEAYEQQNFQRCLELAQQAYKIAPKDSRVLYNLACFLARAGQSEKALEHLEQAVAAGFYCPTHIAEDPDLEGLRQRERFTEAVALARRCAARQCVQEKMLPETLARTISGRLLDVADKFDYVTGVDFTDGYTTRNVTILTLVPDANQGATAPLFARSLPAEGFDKYLPLETVSFSIGGGLDFEQCYRYIEETFLQVGPGGKELWEQGRRFLAGFGFDVQRDLLSWLGGETMTVVLDNDHFVFMMKVKDEQIAHAKIETAIEFLSNAFTELASQNPALAMLAFTREPSAHDSLPNFEELRFMTSQIPLVWGVADGYFVFSSWDYAAAMCLETGRGNHPNIRQNERFMKEALIPSAPFTGLTYTDQRNLGNEISNVLGAVAMSSGMFSLAIPEPEARNVVARLTTMLGKLAPVARRIDFYKSTATLTTYEDRQWRTETVTHFASPEERAAKNAPAAAQ